MTEDQFDRLMDVLCDVVSSSPDLDAYREHNDVQAVKLCLRAARYKVLSDRSLNEAKKG